tara:strand:+ start:633 stop:1586 length:954 start_codon:yes stop_codon:yes gene_type:complete
MNVLITGCAGFIGYSLASNLLKKKNYKIYGIDNLNRYYSISLKKKRLSLLLKKKNFFFNKISLTNKKKLDKFFKNKNIDIVFNFAAQAGVRYVASKPEKFIESNVMGYHNLLESSKKYNIKKFFYASSSSVYGDKNSYPVNENSILKPKNIYGLSKKFNEDYININNNQNTRYIGLRFFTVYGEWGRPDMLILKFLKHTKTRKIFYLNNNGEHWRDFTYIGDVVRICVNLINIKFKKNEIFNVCSNRPVYIKKIVSYLSKKKKFDKIVIKKKDNIEVIKTHGNNKKLLKLIGSFKFANLINKIDSTIKWYDRYSELI